MSETGAIAAGAIAAPAPSIAGQIVALLRRGDIALGIGILAIIVVLILPLPSVLLDFCLALSITFSVLILMTTLFIQRPLEFSAFPTVLLIATMLRLALNLASTRLILAHGHEGTAAAGHVIEAFGNFIMQGNFVIGIIVFSILVIVNFIVITKGSGRIAEVAARFTLDAMPGKQMAIDADLSSGVIDETEARTRRKRLEEESNFFGAMDGASKFVRGDAIAGLLITFVNVLGGMIIGVAQQGLPFSEAASTYTLLTVGDGLVSQIPALIVSVGAGLLVSKSGVEGTADKALFGQLSNYPQALGMSSAVMLTMAVLPGIPAVPFVTLAGIAGGLSWRATRTQRANKEAETRAKTQAAAERMPTEEPIASALAIDNLKLEIGYGLLPLINDSSGHRLTDHIKALRRQLAAEMGFVMPSVRIIDNMSLPSQGYQIRVKEMSAGTGELRLQYLLAMDPRGTGVDLPGERVKEPAFGLAATWVDQGLREEASFRGYTVVDPATVLTTHLTEVIRGNMADLLSYAETKKLVDDLPSEQKKLVEEIVPSQIAMTGIQRVLQSLLNERISVRDLPTILEAIAETASQTSNVMQITEHVRARLARQICNAHLNGHGLLPLLTLSPDWETAFAESLIGQGEERQLSMAPSRLQDFIGAVRMKFDHSAQAGDTPVLLTSPFVRPYVRSIIERFRPQTFVMSQQEIHPHVKLRTLGQV